MTKAGLGDASVRRIRSTEAAGGQSSCHCAGMAPCGGRARLRRTCYARTRRLCPPRCCTAWRRCSHARSHLAGPGHLHMQHCCLLPHKARPWAGICTARPALLGIRLDHMQRGRPESSALGSPVMALTQSSMPATLRLAVGVCSTRLQGLDLGAGSKPGRFQKHNKKKKKQQRDSRHQLGASLAELM